MPHRISFLISFLIVVFSSCNNISPEDITIIDGVKLGSTEEEFHNQCNLLNVEQKTFLTDIYFRSKEQANASQMKFYVTDLFNLTEYRSQVTDHYGLYYPTTFIGTKNVVGLSILLAHTNPAFLFTINGFSDISGKNNISAIKQSISFDHADKIENMLKSKYGNPSERQKSEFTGFYVLDGNQIQEYTSDSTNIGELIIWNTKYLEIKFFKGILSPFSTYKSNDKVYMTYFDNNPFRTIDFEKGFMPCYSYSYISYRLKDEAIIKLELDKPKL